MNGIEGLLKIVLGDERAAHLASLKLTQLSRFPVVEDFAKLIGPKKAEKVIAMMEMNRFNLVCDNRSVLSPEDFLPHLSWLKFEPQEHFVLLSLNSSNEVINKTVIYKGMVNAVPVHPREVFRQALLDNAVSIVVAHNHPSGSIEPSNEDIAITRVLCAAGKVMQMVVLDHIVVGRRGLTSICRMHPEIFEQTITSGNNYQIK